MQDFSFFKDYGDFHLHSKHVISVKKQIFWGRASVLNMRDNNKFNLLIISL